MVSCILLAAGSSSRFGSPKPLARINAKTVIELILQKLLKTRLSEVIVVLGADAAIITPCVIKDHRIKIVCNKDYLLGQTSSFKTGLTKLKNSSDGIMLLPVDMPLIKIETIDFLIDTFLKSSGLILIPTYKGKNGHPPIFSKLLLEEFKILKNEEPLSTIQHKHRADVLKVPVDDEGVVLSFNTPQEFQKIKKRLDID